MTTTLPEQNWALVLKAFDTLFNKRDYVTRSASGRTAIYNMARIFRRAAMAYSISFAALPVRTSPRHVC